MHPLASRFDLFFTNRFWWSLVLLFAGFVLSYAFLGLFIFAKLLSLSFAFLLSIDFFLLVFYKTPLTAYRKTSDKWSLSDENPVQIGIQNHTMLRWRCTVLDELPVELQKRDFSMSHTLLPFDKRTLKYHVRPVKRGKYSYGKIRVFIRNFLGLLQRRISDGEDFSIAVYPSLIQLKKYALYTSNTLATYYGVKSTRRIGQSYEFEVIKDYVQGDDIRNINWKATARSSVLKTNHFIEEKAQSIYAIIDKSRNMNMAFDGMSLLDYSVNSALVLANTAVKKGDRAGLITFSDKIGAAIRADNHPRIIRTIADNLYLQKYRTTEPDFEFLYTAANRVINSRSLLLLYTNFESSYALNRALPVLRKLNRKHLLLVIIFENDELVDFAFGNADNLKDIHHKMVAKQMVVEKRQFASELGKHGILSIITKPENLTVNTINKYLELKSKGVL